MPEDRRFAEIIEALEVIGDGEPEMLSTPKLARQFMFPNGMILRFDLSPGQYSRRQGPHINLELPGVGNVHIYLRQAG